MDFAKYSEQPRGLYPVVHKIRQIVSIREWALYSVAFGGSPGYFAREKSKLDSDNK